MKGMKASNFRKKHKNMPYTRKKFMGGIPGSKIVRFTMGNTNGDFSNRVALVGLKPGQIRHNALEAGRIAANRVMEVEVGRNNYLLRVVPYPHQVLREHKRVNVAQADRFQEGMKKAYGKPVGVAARVDRGDKIMVAEVDEQHLPQAHRALKRASDKLPVPCRLFVQKN